MEIKEKEFMIELTTRKPAFSEGYFYYRKGTKKYKRSRILLQLHLNKKLDIFDIVHHKDGDKTNDNIENLQIMTKEEHTSFHHAGKRR